MAVALRGARGRGRSCGIGIGGRRRGGGCGRECGGCGGGRGRRGPARPRHARHLLHVPVIEPLESRERAVREPLESRERAVGAAVGGASPSHVLAAEAVVLARLDQNHLQRTALQHGVLQCSQRVSSAPHCSTVCYSAVRGSPARRTAAWCASMHLRVLEPGPREHAGVPHLAEALVLLRELPLGVGPVRRRERGRQGR